MYVGPTSFSCTPKSNLNYQFIIDKRPFREQRHQENRYVLTNCSIIKTAHFLHIGKHQVIVSYRNDIPYKLNVMVETSIFEIDKMYLLPFVKYNPLRCLIANDL